MPARRPPDRPRQKVTVHLPVTIALTDEELADAETVNEAVGAAVRLAKDPDVRALGGRILALMRRRLGKNR